MSETRCYILCITAWLAVTVAVSYWAELKLASVDAWLYTVAGRLVGEWPEGEYAQLHRPDSPVAQEQIVLKRKVRRCPRVRFVLWNEENGLGENEQPLPKQQELATILHCLSSKLGVRSVAVSTPLRWEDEGGEMVGLMLQRALKEFDHVGMGMAGRNAPQAQMTPELLAAAKIPMTQVSGELGGLPGANMAQPFSLPGEMGANVLAAPDHMEDEALIREAAVTRGLSLPLLLRWNGEVLASLPLRLALAESGLTPADVHVKLGKSLRIGDLILPLDEHGRTPLGAAQAAQLPLNEVLTAYMPLPDQERGCAVLYRPFFSSPTSGERAERLAATLSLLLSRETETLIPSQRPAGGRLFEQNVFQSTLTGRLFAIALLLSILLFVPRIKSLLWRRAAMYSLLGVIVAAICCYAQHGIWVSICSWLLCWGILALAQRHLASRSSGNEPMLW